MRQLLFLGLTLAATMACGGSNDSGKKNSGEDDGGAGEAAADGGLAAGGASQGGTGGVPAMGGSAGRTGMPCTTTADCPQPGCFMCAGYTCVDGRCVGGTVTGSGGASGGLRWFATCGPPVCGPPATGGASSGVPACEATEVEGASCRIADARCDTGDSCSGPLQCATSDPTNGGQCPRSRASYKTDIEYLSSAERVKLAEDVQSIPLVRYRYKDGPEREHLGFIIEDVEPSPSVDSAGDRVDLYGYTSMAIAALQEQRREIERLRAEIDELRREVAEQKGPAPQ